LRDALEGPDVQFVLAHARDLRAIAHRAQKNDSVDAHMLARMLRADLIPTAHAHATEELEWLRLVRHHAWLTQYRTRCANRIHAQLQQSGIRLQREQLLTARGKEALRNAAPRLSAEQRRLIRTHLTLIKMLTVQLGALRKLIRRAVEQSPAALLLRTIPGIGPYWSLLLSAELSPVERFRSADHLVSYAGLAPTTKSSGGQVHYGPLPNAANRWVRGAFVAAAMSHIRYAPESKLSQHYARTKARIGWKKARVATARRLARIAYAVLRYKRPWHE